MVGVGLKILSLEWISGGDADGEIGSSSVRNA